MEDILLESQNGAVAELRLNRPAQRHALSLAMIEQLQSALDRLKTDPSVHVIVLSSDGPAFCAGHDLKEITEARAADDNGRVFFETIMSACSAMMESIVTHPKPVIAAVQGVATAAGCQLVASCDLALASKEAGFATPGVNIGLFCSTPMVALSRNVGKKAAMEMLLTGDIIPAETAKDIGLINRVVPARKLASETLALAEQIASKSPKTLKIGKEAFYKQAEMPLSDAYAYSSQAMIANLLDRESREGIEAFIAKRPPSWSPLD